MSESNIKEKENEIKENIRTKDTWKNALIGDLLLFGYWMVPKDVLKEKINFESNKTTILATLFMLLSSMAISIMVLGIIDGPELVTALLTFDFTVHSAFLYGYVIYSFLLIWIIFIGMGFLLPFIARYSINSSSKRKSSMKKIYIASCYGVLSILIYALIVYAFALLFNGSNPQMVQLNFQTWQNVQLYIIMVIILIAIDLNSKLSGKIMDVKEKFLKFESISIFVALALCVAAFFLV